MKTGYQVLIEGLTKRFGAQAVETSTMAIIEMLTFRRRDRDSIDEAIARFEITRTRVQGIAPEFQLPTQASAWLLLEAHLF